MLGVMSIPDTDAKRRWDAENTVHVSLKLNCNTDKDILAAIDGKPKQPEIKRLIRLGLKTADPPTGRGASPKK